MTDRAQPKERALTQLPQTEVGDDPAEPEALAHAVRDHRRAVEETVEALKTKFSRATDRVEHAREKVDDATVFVREHRWPLLGVASVLGLLVGIRARRPQRVQLMLPSGLPGESVVAQPARRQRTFVRAAVGAIGSILLRELGWRALERVEAKLRR